MGIFDNELDREILRDLRLDTYRHQLLNFLETVPSVKEISNEDKAKAISVALDFKAYVNRQLPTVYEMTAYICSGNHVDVFATGVFDKIPNLKAIRIASSLFCMENASYHPSIDKVRRAVVALSLREEEITFAPEKMQDNFGDEFTGHVAEIPFDSDDVSGEGATMRFVVTPLNMIRVIEVP